VPAWADTLELARRFVPASNYRLSTLVTELGLNSPATHDAGEVS
jgi:DNA polymerase III epsilon subunit-like protein